MERLGFGKGSGPSPGTILLNPFDPLPRPSSAATATAVQPTREKEMEKPPPTQSPTAPSLLPPPHQAPLHQSDSDEEDENVKQLGDCSSVYLLLQDCLVNSNRNWKSCQKEVQALKACNDQRKNHGGK